MSIRKKTLLILVILFAVLTASMTFLSRAFLLSKFAELEAADAKINVRRASAELDSLREMLDAIAGDWGPWDATYEFMVGEAEDYVARNLNDEVLQNLDIHFFSFWNLDGSHRLTKFIDPATGRDQAPPQGLLPALRDVLPLMKPDAVTGGPSGLIRFEETLLLTAFRPVATSEFQGPVRGTIVAGRLLTPREIERISEKTHLAVSLEPLREIRNIPGPEAVILRLDGPNRIIGATRLRDIHGQPAARLTVSLPRDIFRKGWQAWVYYVLSMLILLLLFIVVTSLLLERNVLARLSRLHQQVGDVVGSDDPQRRLPEPEGTDEVAGLHRRINDMLDALADYHQRQREAEAYLQTLLDSIHCGVLVIDAESQTIADLNRAASEMVGLEKEAAVGRVCHDFVCPARRGDCPILDQGETLDYSELELLRADGDRLPILKTARTVERKGRKYLVESFVDISRLKEAQAALTSSEEKYRRFFEQDLTGDFITSPEGRIVDCNLAFARTFGYDSVAAVKGINTYDLYPNPRDRDHLLERLRREKVLEHYNWELRRRDGHPVYAIGNIIGEFDAQGELSGIRGYLFDDTQRILLERNQRQRQKMEAIGTLAGGIAHDFNNILAVILGYVELCLRTEIGDGERLRERLNQVLQAGHRAKELVGHILTFSRQQERERRPIQPDLIIKEGIQFLRATLPPDIQFKTEIPDDVGVILADPTQLHQVFLNLCGNAAHAMKGRGGRISVVLENVVVGPAEMADFPDLKPGPHVRLRISDTGVGMTPEVAERIFEPFFTTKATGEGTGMGLAVVHGIVRSHKGGIRVESQRGRGAAVDVLFPRSADASTPIPREIGVCPAGAERILLVDDEPFLVDAMREVLENLGYRVTARTSPVEAMAAFQAGPDAYDLLLTDLAMPKINGEELARRVRNIRPEIPVILCTGFSDAGLDERGKALGIRVLLRKPVLMRELAVAVRHALDGSAEREPNRGEADSEPSAGKKVPTA